ncbi:MAG: hypothetical protein NVS3B21_04700 [Acidimicrobiales bacterium]
MRTRLSTLLAAATIAASAATALAAPTPAIAAEAPPSKTATYTLNTALDPSKSTPLDIGVVNSQFSLTLTASGTAFWCNDNKGKCVSGPAGAYETCNQAQAGLCPLQNEDLGALAYKIGEDGAWKFAGPGPVVISSPTGAHVYVAYNDVYGAYSDNTGSYALTVTRTKADGS